MTRLISFACALAALALAGWSVILTRQTSAEIDQARSVYLSSTRGGETRAGAPADRLGSGEGGDAARDTSLEPPTPASRLLAAPRAASGSGPEAAEASNLLPPVPTASRPVAPGASASGPLGYTLPQNAPAAATPATPATPDRSSDRSYLPPPR
jgi:hypothetical protein